MGPDNVKMVHLIPEHGGEFQALYLDREANWLRPNLRFVRDDGTIRFETNEIGLKGDPVDPNRKLVVVWGDSVVFGIGRGWPELLNDYFPEYQFLNGGIEGNSYAQVLERAVKLNQRLSISLNLIMIGWHPTDDNQNVKTDLIKSTGSITNPIFMTMPTALNKDVIEKDLTEYFRSGTATHGFTFMGNLKYSVSTQIELYQHIAARNQIIRQTAAELAVPLIDMFAAFDTTRLPDFREHFFDVPHPRPSAYPRLAIVVADAITPLIRSDWQYRGAPAVEPTPAPAPRRWLGGLRKAFERVGPSR